MNTFRAFSSIIAGSLMMTGISLSPAEAEQPAAQYEVAQADCYAVGMQYAARVGGQLARATPEVRGGQQVCVVVVLMPARDGQRPRREEIVIPAG